MQHRLSIQQFSSYVSQVMSENRQNPTGLPSEKEIGTTLAFLERGLEDLQRQLDGSLTSRSPLLETCQGIVLKLTFHLVINQIMLCCACLQLRAFYFFETPHRRQRGLLKTYATALSLIDMTQEATEKSGLMIYAPGHFGHILLMAGVTVLKILHSSFSVFVDFAEGKRAFNSVVTLLRRASIEDNDLPGKSSKILAQLWAIHDPSTSKSGQGNEPLLRLRTRSSASVMHDALWVWRERFAKKPTPAGPAADMPGSSSSPEDMPQSNSTTETANLFNESNPEFSVEGMGAFWDMNLPWLLPMDLDTYFSREDQQMDLPNFQYSLEADANS